MAPVHEVAFELECFEWSDGRLDVAGRWRGLAGRRLARPVLTLQTDAGRRKRLVAMPGGQLGAPGETWRASFNWPRDPAEIVGAELELGRNVVVDLPLPDRRRRRRRRQPPAEPPVDATMKAELTALHAQVQRLRDELAARERELMALREEVGERPPDEQSTVELQARLEAVERERQAERERHRADLDVLREAFADAAAEAEDVRERHTAELAALRPAPVEPGPNAQPPGGARPLPPSDPAPPPGPPADSGPLASAAAAAPGPMLAGAHPAAPALMPAAGVALAAVPSQPTVEAEAAPAAVEAPAAEETFPHTDDTAGMPRLETGAHPPLRSASAARARAGATVAARRTPAEVWAIRVLAAGVAALLLICFVLLVASLA